MWEAGFNMDFTGKNEDEKRILGLLDGYLGFRARTGHSRTDGHLDEDSIAAFIDGRLSEREAAPLVGHLADCGFCLHVTSELARLDFAFADEPSPAPVADEKPSKISEVLNGLMSRIFGSADGAVFAHEDPEAKEDNPDHEPKSEG
jgi:hypothetical protein